MNIAIEHNNKIYNFNLGYEAYIFDHAVSQGIDKKYGEKALKEFVCLVGDCYLKDTIPTPLGALSDYVAMNWKTVKELSRSDILEEFYDHLNR